MTAAHRADHQRAWAQARRECGSAWGQMSLSARTFRVAQVLAELRQADEHHARGQTTGTAGTTA